MRTNVDGKNLEIVRQPLGILTICVNPDVHGGDVWNDICIRSAERTRYAFPGDDCHYWPELKKFVFGNEAGDEMTLIIPADSQFRGLRYRTGESFQSTTAGTSESSIPAPTQDKQPEPAAAGQSSSTSSKSTLGHMQDKPQPGPSGCGADEFDSDESPPALTDATSGEDSRSDELRVRELREFTKTNKGKPVLIKYVKLENLSKYSRSRHCDNCGLGFVSQELLCDVKASGREVLRKKSKYPCWCSCKTAVYCSVLCQRLHWQQHKPVCPWRKSETSRS